jgi:hypothetical protein
MSLLNWTDNAPAIQLLAPIHSTDTVINVSTSGGYPTPPFEFAIDLSSAPELCLCQDIISNTVWQVVRGWDGSTAQSHNPASGQIGLITSEQFWTEVNVHLVQDPYQHTQYMRADGTGHDTPTQHSVGSGDNVAINTVNAWNTFQGSMQVQQASYVLQNRFSQLYLNQPFDPTQPPISHFGDTGYDGLSDNPANGGHVHGRETADEIDEGHLWPPGTLALWAGSTPPSGWLPCDGRDVRTDLAPLCFDQWGFTCGSAVAWYPPAPTWPTYIGYLPGTYTDPDSQAILTVEVPYSYAQDPRQIALQLPYGEPLYFKLPNLPAPAPGLSWIVKMDYGYVWEPRPSPPPSQPIFAAPFRVDATFPALEFFDNWEALPSQSEPWSSGVKFQEDVTVVEAPHPPGRFQTAWTWGYDAATGLPIVNGTDYIGPGQPVSGTIVVPVYPFGTATPEGYTLLEPAQPSYQVGPPIIVNEELMQLYGLRVPVVNGYGWVHTDSYPPADGSYLVGVAQAQQRDNDVAITVSKASISNPGVPDQPFSGTVSVFFFIYSL